jgi:hypothetical protein
MKTTFGFKRSGRFLRPVPWLSTVGLVCVTILFGVQFSARAQQNGPPMAGLVGWWQGNGNGNDSASTNNGIVGSNVSFVGGLFGQAFSFPGTAPGYVYIPDCAAFKLTNSLSIAAWVYPRNYGINGGIVLERGDYYTQPFYMTFDSGGRLLFVMNFSSPGQTVLYPTNVVPLNAWTHIAGTLDGSTGDMRIYINGNLIAETITSNRPIANLNPAQHPGIGIGANSDDDTGYLFNGYIEEALLYSRALSPSEIQLLNCYTCTCTPHAATATANLSGGFVVAATITDGGCGYSNTPAVLIQGGGGTGAGGTAVVSNGEVIGITITNAGFGYTSAPSIYISFPLSITGPPQSLNVNAYDTASFAVTASGTSPLSYQWSLNGTNLLGDTSSTLTVSNVTPSDLGIYTVTISDVFGSETNVSATLSMYPFILTPFTGAVIYWGTNANFSVQAWGSDPLTYQWYDNGVAIPDATNDTLTFSDIQYTNAGTYTVVVGNPLGSVTNAPAQVVVNPDGVSIGLYPGVTVSGVVGVSYTIQRMAGLTGTNSWTTVANLTLTQPVETWVDTNINASLPSNPQYFYQVLPDQ